jgi:hypothetical protein
MVSDVRGAGSLTLVVLGAVYVGCMGFGVQTMGDYPGDYAPATDALLAGHVGGFFAQLPTNGAGGSVLLRAPAALLGKLLVGNQLSIFRFGAVASVLVLGGIGLLLAHGMRKAGRPPLARAAVIGLCVLTPAVLDAIRFGHPEEALGAALCVGAVLLAGDGRGALAGVAAGFAVTNKPWGVLALAPALLAAPRKERLRFSACAGAIAGAWVAAGYLVSPAHFAQTVHGASSAVVAHPVDLWWPLDHLRLVPGVMPAYFPPRFLSDHARELAVLLAVPLSVPLARRREPSTSSSLALLALLFLLRCVLDPSNHVYYQVPFVVALTAWEARSNEAPVLALLATGGFWLVFHTISGTGSLTAQFVAYLAVALPLGAVLVPPAIGWQRKPALDSTTAVLAT